MHVTSDLLFEEYGEISWRTMDQLWPGGQHIHVHVVDIARSQRSFEVSRSIHLLVVGECRVRLYLQNAKVTWMIASGIVGPIGDTSSVNRSGHELKETKGWERGEIGELE